MLLVLLLNHKLLKPRIYRMLAFENGGFKILQLLCRQAHMHHQATTTMPKVLLHPKSPQKSQKNCITARSQLGKGHTPNSPPLNPCCAASKFQAKPFDPEGASDGEDNVTMLAAKVYEIERATNTQRGMTAEKMLRRNELLKDNHYTLYKLLDKARFDGNFDFASDDSDYESD